MKYRALENHYTTYNLAMKFFFCLFFYELLRSIRNRDNRFHRKSIIKRAVAQLEAKVTTEF